MVQTLTLCGISNGMRKSLATRPKDFRNTLQRLWQYAPKTLAIRPKDFWNTPQRLWEHTPKTLGG
ncbi:MAG: hypothetical protein IKY22_09290 [Bacteroidales bacterium]|nr:hypothetical protein [Bacteroidales bacterium]